MPDAWQRATGSLPAGALCLLPPHLPTLLHAVPVAATSPQGIAPYNPDALGVSERLPPLPEPAEDGGRRRQSRTQRDQQARERLNSAQAAWRPWSNSAVYTVADVAPLRWMQHVMDGVPLQPAPHARLGAGDAVPQGQQEPCAGVAGVAGAAELPASQQQGRGQEQQPPNGQQQQLAEASGSGSEFGQQQEQAPPGQAEGEDEISSDEDMQLLLRCVQMMSYACCMLPPGEGAPHGLPLLIAACDTHGLAAMR